MHALVSATLSAAVIAALESDLDWQLTYVKSIAAALEDLTPGDRAAVQVLVLEADPIDAVMISSLPGLEIIACLRSDPVNVDVAAATSRGIPVIYSPGRNAEAVADFTLGLCLAALRSIAIGHYGIKALELTRNGADSCGAVVKDDVIWRPSDPLMDVPYLAYKGRELSGLTVGVVGFGAVGRAVARRFRGLVSEVVVVDPGCRADEIEAAGLRAMSLPEMLPLVDVVTLHARSRSVIIGRDQLSLMKPGSYLINTARATVLDYEALGESVLSGHLRGAALDVFPEEPLPSGSPLLQLPGLTLTPHIAGAAEDVITRQSLTFLATLRGLYSRTAMWSELSVRNREVQEQWYGWKGVRQLTGVPQERVADYPQREK
ncbi:MAG: NAD(P)-dependent oxidoreductase [Acidimicrobiales bacterium]